MYDTCNDDLKIRLQLKQGSNKLRILAFTLAFALGVPAFSYCYSLYSGSSVGSEGTIYGWGVTDGTPPPYPPMVHNAYSTTTLTSPHGRSRNSSRLGGVNTVRADVNLPYDPTDLGTYTVQSFHDVWCTVILQWIFLNVVSASNVFFCDIPTGETINSGGWDDIEGEQAVQLWMQTLQPPTRLFGGRSVQEFVTGTVQDDCWYPNSRIGKASLTNPVLQTGPWPVSPGGVWGPDKVGWTMSAVIQYRRDNRAPCSAIVPQRMGCLCTINSTYYSYLTHNLRMTLGTVSVSSTRGSKTVTRTLTTN
jgi:hypothetical protein